MTAPYRTVVVGTDGSVTAGRAVARAVALAAACEARGCSSPTSATRRRAATCSPR